MHEIVAPAIQAVAAGKDTALAPDASLAKFRGVYDFAPWGVELIVCPWKDSLGLLELPSTQPVADLIRLRAVPASPGRFRWVKENDVLGELIDFDLNAGGQVTHLRRWNNPMPKVPAR